LAAVQTAAFGVLAWRSPVVAVCCFGLANVVAPALTRWWLRLLTLAPFFAISGLVYAAWKRGAIGGLWLPHWMLGLAGLVAWLARVSLRRGRAKPPKKTTGAKRRGLPKARDARRA